MYLYLKYKNNFDHLPPVTPVLDKEQILVDKKEKGFGLSIFLYGRASKIVTLGENKVLQVC
jgi:hypothetical protein